ncbi:hypothetical protein [Pectobacterium sp. F1-1]|uniref:hypothetical protein n=1 Tax=Pectobacterium sp. F1-1 TaxID=2949614 RepID=UPI0021D7BB1B|nr:hypothetical protein [Pectobacterium sp. F1-1]
MAKKVTILRKSFDSQGQAQEFFSKIRLRIFETKEEINRGDEFDLLSELYKKYCQYTNYETSGTPESFKSQYERRGKGSNGGTTISLAVSFNGVDYKTFSADKAVVEIANKQNP